MTETETKTTTKDHSCVALECSNPIPPGLLLCRKHWRILPDAAKALVKKHYDPEKVGAADPGMEHELAVSIAVAIVKEAEGHTLSELENHVVMAFKAASGNDVEKERLDLHLHAQHVGAIVEAGEPVAKDKVVKRAQERRKSAQQAARDRQNMEEASGRPNKPLRSPKRGRKGHRS